MNTRHDNISFEKAKTEIENFKISFLYFGLLYWEQDYIEKVMAEMDSVVRGLEKCLKKLEDKPKRATERIDN